MLFSLKGVLIPAAALACLPIAACGEKEPEPVPMAPPAMTDPATPMPETQPDPSTMPNPADPTDGQAVPPASPPPVLPTTPPT